MTQVYVSFDLVGGAGTNAGFQLASVNTHLSEGITHLIIDCQNVLFK